MKRMQFLSELILVTTIREITRKGKLRDILSQAVGPYWATSAFALGCQICRNDDENDYDDDDENDDCDDDDENDRHWATSAGALSCCQICNNH